MKARLLLTLVVISTAVYAGSDRWSRTSEPLVWKDNQTGLEWDIRTGYYSDWDDSVGFCENFAGFGGGWRLPTIKELEAIVVSEDTDCGESPCRLPDFFRVQGVWIWSATEIDQTHAWAVEVANGKSVELEKDTYFRGRHLCTREAKK